MQEPHFGGVCFWVSTLKVCLSIIYIKGILSLFLAIGRNILLKSRFFLVLFQKKDTLMIKVPINNHFVLADLCVALACANGIKINRNAPICTIGKQLAKNVTITGKKPKRFSQPWYQGLMLNYVQNNGKIVPPLRKFYSPSAHGMPPVIIEVPEQLWNCTTGRTALYIKSHNKSKSGYSKEAANSLYSSNEWRRLRYMALREQGGRCQLCGRSRKDGVVLHVDHIIPLSVDWSKRLDMNNLQVLCSDCNLGKSNTDTIDWRG